MSIIKNTGNGRVAKAVTKYLYDVGQKDKVESFVGIATLNEKGVCQSINKTDRTDFVAVSKNGRNQANVPFGRIQAKGIEVKDESGESVGFFFNYQ